MGLDCFQEVKKRLADGWTVASVVKFIQEERKEYTDITPQSLRTHLQEYRSTLSQDELGVTALTHPALMAKAAVEKAAIEAPRVARGMDVLFELEQLYDLQMERIRIDFSKEKMIGKTFPSNCQEIRTAREILHEYAELQMDLGVANRHLGQLDVNTQITADITARYGKPIVAEMLASPDSRRKVLGVVEKMLQLGAREAASDPDIIDVSDDSVFEGSAGQS
jgi:hypothetical protein